MTKPVIIKGKLVSGHLVVRSLKKGDSYYMMLECYENGKRKQKMESTGLPAKGNAREARALLSARVREFDLEIERQQTALPESDMRFSDWVRRWLEQTQRRLDPVTWQGYDITAKNHVLPYFDQAATTLAELNRPLLQDYIDHKHTSGRKDGKGGLAPKTIRHIKNVLQLALKAAVQANLIQANYCEGLLLPRAVRHEYQFYNQEELNHMFDVLRNEPLYALFRVTVVYGLRLSELSGLQWDSVDFKNDLLTVKHSRVQMRTVVEKDTTKTKSSYRSFPLLPDIRELLLQAKAAEEENRQLFGGEYIETPYIFKWASGKPYDPSYVSRNFAKVTKKHGLSHIRFHDLRHSSACLLLAMGMTPKDVQEWLGHANISITMDVYGHLDFSRKKHIADNVAQSLAASC
ncbi:MAG: site-specific integrase [Oscillospiraceae bacterium]|nr:site-specific integrase [Oscillospiraceae bacterium]